MNFSKFFATILIALILTTAGFAANGDLDMVFNPTISPATGISIAIVNEVAVQTDGKILIAGTFSAVGGVSRNGIARLNADGSLDTSFNPGTGVSDSSIDSLAVAPDGKILIGGVFSSFNGTPRQRVARLNADGSLDTSFNSGTEATSRVNGLAVQTDGKVLIGVAGSTVKRLNTDGTLDNTFTTTMTPQVGVLEIKLQADGKILIGGGWDFLNGAEYRFGLARLNADGTTDNSFVPHQNDFNLYGASVAEILPQTDGKIVAVGNLKINSTGTGFNKHIVRFNSNGTIDNTFDSGADANNTIWSVYRQANGKYVIGGNFSSFNSTARIGMARLNANGSLDNTFNASLNASTRVQEIISHESGKLLVGGTFSQVNSTARTGFARLENAAPNRAAICDYDGDGKTDYAIRRIVSSQFMWYIGLSGGGETVTAWGRSGNQVVCGDFDGDAKTDITVWQQGAASTAGFWILQSSTNTLRFEQFGQTGDNATVVDDFDGDGKTDVAVYRNGAAAGEQSYFYYRGSANNPNGNVSYIPWGIQFDRPYTGDFDGDGKADIAVYQNDTGGARNFFVLKSSDNQMLTYRWGINLDFPVTAFNQH